MVRFSHSVFALPFALSGTALAAIEHGFRLRQGVWIVVCMVAARNAAMGFNRLVDQRIDAANPRTADRELPRGALGRGSVWAFTVFLATVFVFGAFRLNPLCGWLSIPALAIVLGYSYAKRFTWACHLLLGVGLAIAPVGGWLAVAGSFAWTPWILALAVTCWVAGFDILYACQDEAFDRAHGLHSVPARFGARRALAIARGLHATAFVAMAAVGPAAGLGTAYAVGMAVIGIILVWEHRLVRPDDLSRLGAAFFNMNALVSVAYLVVVLVAAFAFPADGG
jgi:4-hydroxybenzoate polyprenyltransferase